MTLYSQPEELPPDKPYAIRHAKAQPIADVLHQRMLIHGQKVPDGSSTAKALDYNFKRWTALTRCYSHNSDQIGQTKWTRSLCLFKRHSDETTSAEEQRHRCVAYRTTGRRLFLAGCSGHSRAINAPKNLLARAST